MNFEEKSIRFIIERFEGGYVDHPKDPGGETKYGISKRSYPDLDIKNLTIKDAVNIYRKDYAKKIRFDEFVVINPRLAFCLLDCAIHSGPVRAVKILQSAGKVTEDGKMDHHRCATPPPKHYLVLLEAVMGGVLRRFLIGPATFGVAGSADIVKKYLAARAFFLSGLKNYRTFARGWLARIFEQSDKSLGMYNSMI